MQILKKGEKVVCPYCNSVQEDPVEDFVIPGKIGTESIAECYDCDGIFYVTAFDDGTFEVSAK